MYSDVHAGATLPPLTPALWLCARLPSVDNTHRTSEGGPDQASSVSSAIPEAIRVSEKFLGATMAPRSRLGQDNNRCSFSARGKFHRECSVSSARRNPTILIVVKRLTRDQVE